MSILIVGAGPTGLMMALQLARRGVACRLVDKNPSPAHESRALVIQARTLEILQQLGLAEEFLRAGQSAIDVTVVVEGRPRGTLRLGGLALADTAFPNLLFLSQAKTEELLGREVERLGVRIERGRELRTFQDGPQGVEYTLENGETGRCTYLVGCDGAHSVVRHRLGVEFPGAPYEQSFVLADVDIAGVEDLPGLKFFLDSRGLLVLFPLKDGSYRIVASRAGLSGETFGEATLEKVQALASELSRRSLRLSQPRWLANFRLHHRGVKQFRVGRVFLAGDAAHIHSPAGGQGMNTGLQDATNLAWKLASAVQGRGNEALLDTYQEERFPVSRHLLATTDRFFQFATASNSRWLWWRNRLVPIAFWFVLKSPFSRVLRKKAFRFVSQLAVRYRHGKIYEFACQRPDPWAGVRLPDAPLAESTLHRSLSGFAGYHLLCFDACEESADAICRTLHVELNRNDLLRKRLNAGPQSYFLIRPDGYIAFSGQGAWRERVAEFFKKFHSVD